MADRELLEVPLKLSPAEWALLPRFWWTLYWVDRGIRRRPYKQWRHWLTPQYKASAPTVDPQRARQIVRLTERVARHHLRPMNCLRRSLAAKRLLERQGIACAVHIGVQGGEAGLEAHIWLSDGAGGILNDSSDVSMRYRELSPDQWATTLGKE